MSGFILSYTYLAKFHSFGLKSYRTFLVRRLARIYPVHLATLLAVLAMVLVSRRAGISITEKGYTWKQFAQNVFLVHQWEPHPMLNWNYPSWSISCEWFAYLWFPLAAWVLARVRGRLTAGLFLAGSWALSIAVYRYWGGRPFPEIVHVTATFLLGMTLFLAIKSGLGKRMSFRYLPELCTAVLLAWLFLAPSSWLAVGYISAFTGVIGGLAHLGNRCSAVWTNPVAVYLGKISYSVYMAHTLGQKLCYGLTSSAKFASASIAAKVGVLAFYAIATAVFCLATYYIVERPCHEYFKRKARAR